jgi:hypothetical protein
MGNQKRKKLGNDKPKPETFGTLLADAPKIKNLWRATIAGILFQSDRKGKFVLQTADGTFYEFNVQSVEAYRVLKQKGEYVVVEVTTSARELSDGTLSPHILTSHRHLTKAAIAFSAPAGEHLLPPNRRRLHDHLATIAKDSAHPIHQYWEFDTTTLSPFQQFGHPFSSAEEIQSDFNNSEPWE